MRRVILFIAFLPAWMLQAQPLNGSFTIGGATPDFAELQDAANAVKSRGVSGPVFFNIRPGTYTRDGGASTLFVLDSSIAGVSPTNRVTFQPDAGSGGNGDNVILQADFNSSSSRQLVKVQADFVTLRDLTFRDADSMDTPVGYFIFAPIDGNNLAIEGLEIHNCTFLGTPYFISGGEFGSDIGIGSAQNLASATFTHNRFYRVMRGITNENGSTRGGTIVVEDNEFYQGFGGATGTGNQLGTAIEVACTHASIRRNIIDMAGGRGGVIGIRVAFATTAVIERNLIKNRVAVTADGFTGISVSNIFFPVDSIVIANNAIVANQAVVHTRCMDIQTPNTKVLYNTMVNSAGGGGDNIALFLNGANCTVLNNIILELSDASFVAFDQGNAGLTTNLVSDYNIIFLPTGHGESGLVRSNGTVFSTLIGYQAGSGLDSHSVFTTVLFSDLFHLDACQAQDPDLIGIPIPGITIDYDGAPRDGVKPFKGADESVRIPFDMFADGFRAGLSGAPLSLAAGDFFDNDNDDDIAVPDFDNHRVVLFRNQRPGRSFVQSGTLSTIVPPTVIKLFDFDNDGHPDLIVGGDTTAVDVFWGEATGGFGSRVTVGTFGRVRSLEPEPGTQSGVPTIWITEDNGFLPSTGFLGYLLNLGGRQLCHDVKYRQGPPPSFFMIHDTIPTVMTDLVVGNIDTSDGLEVVALGISPIPSRCVVLRGLTRLFLSGVTCNQSGFVGSYAENQFGTASYAGHSSNIVMGDFDKDGDNDILTTSASENTCIFIRNLGNVLLTAGDTIPTTQTQAIVALDYENDGDLDFIAANRTLYDHGITVFLNDGLGHFTEKPNCFFPFASGFPNGMVASDFDRDGKTDIAIASSFDSLFVLYNIGGFNGTTGVDDIPQQQLPDGILLSQNYPNPFNPSTRIQYTLSAQSHVVIKVYTILGQEVVSLVDEVQTGGVHAVQWNGRTANGVPVSSGVYFYRLETRHTTGQFLFASVKKMILMK